MWPRQKNRSRSDEPPKAHTPQMTRDALRPGDAAADKHANIPRRGNNGHRTKKSVRPSGIAILQPRLTKRRFQPKGQRDSHNRQHNQQRAPIKTIRPPIPAPRDPPRRCHQVERQSAPQYIARLMLHQRHVHPARGQAKHRHNKYIPTHTMPPRALPERYCDRTGQQTQGPSANMKKQHGRK